MKPIRVTPLSSARSTAREDGAETAASTSGEVRSGSSATLQAAAVRTAARLALPHSPQEEVV